MQQVVETEGVNDQEERKRTRRKRNCEDERLFKCGQCSKSYLSNAALYTHVKNKHDQNNRNSNKEKSGDGSGNSDGEDDEPIVEEYKEENLENLRHVLKKYFPERNKGCSSKQITESLTNDQQEFFSPLLNYWSENWDKPYVRELVTID